MNIKKLFIPLAVVVVSFVVLTSNVIASNIPTISTACESKSGELTSFNDGFSFLKKCNGDNRRVILIGQQGPKGDKGDTGPQGPKGDKGDPAPTDTGKHILDLQQVRGSLWQDTDAVNNVATPDHVTINCSKSCNLWVNYDVDTRNTSAPFQHLYMIYVDGVDQAVFNQATMTTPNAAVPLAVNGVFPESAGSHTVSIYARTYGGILQSYESHLQVMAVEQ